MGNIAIEVENLSKQYRLGEVGTGSLSHDINRLWYKLRGKDDPYLRLGEENDRTKKGLSDYVWALRDINFNVKHGEVLGIIGRNGAGKSTLLKILSRTTKPTTGSIKIKGRVASLLEVGTGFHPELSGRDNIFLNGAILGMTKAEIKSKFDEIVDFAGVEKYISTPVKRYSSGMYVRLAFAVAAHLEPEILIVDEVLAVGDAEFQAKALGKMKDVSNSQGRTVLFVSHNMEAIQNLCERAVLLNQGRIASNDSVKSVLTHYYSTSQKSRRSVSYALDSAPEMNGFRLLAAQVTLDGDSDRQITVDDSFFLKFRIEVFREKLSNLDITFHMVDERGILIYVGSTIWSHSQKFKRGYMCATCFLPGGVFNHGHYTITELIIVENKGNAIAGFKDVLEFDIIPNRQENFVGLMEEKQGVLKLKQVQWELNSSENGEILWR